MLAGALLTLGALALALVPWCVVRAVCVPLGLPRLAYVLGWLAVARFWRDRRGGALLGAAWALAFVRPAQAARAAAWVEARLGRSTPLRGAGVVAHGLLWSARGETERARTTLLGLLHMDPSVVPAVASRLACDWLVADAAARGHWRSVRALAYRPTAFPPRSRSARFLGAAAARLCGDEEAQVSLGQDWRGPTDAQLFFRWLASGRWRSLRPLLRRALATPRREALPPRQAASVDVPQGCREDVLADALALHAQTLRRSVLFLRARELRRLGAAWDAALVEQGTMERVQRRARALSVEGGDALARLSATVVTDLAALARAAQVCIADELGPSETGALARAARLLGDGLLTHAEAACEALRRRVKAERQLPLLDEWREFEALRAQYEHVARLGGMRVRRLLWPTYHRAACAHGVWMFNERKERVFGNTVAHYLLTEAEALGDAERIELQRKNVACGT